MELLRKLRKQVDIRMEEPERKYFVDGEGFTEEGLITWMNKHFPENYHTS